LQVKGQYTNLASDVAEYRETADLFKNAARGISNAWKAARKQYYRNVRIEDVPAVVLGYDFGVKPLVDTVMESVDRLNPVLNNPPPIRHYVRRVNSKEFSTSVYGNWEWAWGEQVDTARIYVRHLNYHKGFTFGNPAEWALEALRFSYIVDYAINVGDTLSALDALAGVDVLTGWHTVRRRSFSLGDYTHMGQNVEGKGRSTYRYYSRSVLTTVPLPNQLFWQPSGSWKKLRDGVALLWAVRSR